MFIREWFGIKNHYHEDRDVDNCFDGLLKLYVKSLKEYFGEEDADNIDHLLSSLDATQLDKGKYLFLKWFNEKGLYELKKMINLELPNTDEIIALIEYEKFILEEELDFKYPDDIRSCLINITTGLHESIKNYQQMSASIQETSEEYSLTYPYKKKEFNSNELTYTVKKEPALDEQVLFF